MNHFYLPYKATTSYRLLFYVLYSNKKINKNIDLLKNRIFRIVLLDWRTIRPKKRLFSFYVLNLSSNHISVFCRMKVWKIDEKTIQIEYETSKQTAICNKCAVIHSTSSKRLTFSSIFWMKKRSNHEIASR